MFLKHYKSGKMSSVGLQTVFHSIVEDYRQRDYALSSDDERRSSDIPSIYVLSDGTSGGGLFSFS